MQCRQPQTLMLSKQTDDFTDTCFSWPELLHINNSTELNASTRFALSPGQGKRPGVVPAQPSRVPAVLTAAGAKAETRAPLCALCVSSSGSEGAAGDQRNLDGSLDPLSGTDRHFSSVISQLHPLNWIAWFTAAIKAFLKR